MAKPHGHSNPYVHRSRVTAPADTSKKEKYKKSKRPTYTPKDREGDPFSHKEPGSPLILDNPPNIETEVELDDDMKNYTIHEKMGDLDYRPPSSMTFEEYMKYRNQQMARNYWRTRSQGLDGESAVSGRSLVPKVYVRGLEGPFGSNYVDIRPNGMVTLDFGGKWQRVNNPNIPIRQQRNGGFDFEQQISMNVVGKIGEKLKLTANWDTKATFDFQNNIKLEYTGSEEDILQKVEAGVVNLPVNSSLISGAQNLFGIKTKMQFGRLTVTSVASSQRGKAEEIRIQGGAQARDFEIRADDYDYLRHFFLSHYFKDRYESSLKSLPIVNSGVKLTRVDVYVTNRTNNTRDLRNIIAYMDLGEGNPYQTSLHITGKDSLSPADNNVNKLYGKIVPYRDPATLTDNLRPEGLDKGTDFETIKSARKLLPTEYRFHPDLGYITLNTPIREDEVLAVAFEYSFNGQKYVVGEMPEDYLNLPADSSIILKMLKPASIKTRLPTWDLMMQNIYQLGANQISRENFQLRVIYKDDYTGRDLPSLQEGRNTANVPLLRIVGLDRLNPNNDPQPDGNFDYVEDVTIDPRYGRIIFPVLKPFGETMRQRFEPDEAHLVEKYVFYELYDSTKSDARLVSSKNKYFLKGRYQSTSTSDIILPGFNIAPGSVVVMAGSSRLVEGVDYTIDYNLGRLKIINEGVMASNQEIKIRFEKQDIFNFRRKAFFGSRFDYTISEDFILGGTILHQNETPNITRVTLGDEPSRNTMYHLDANFKKDSRFLTKAVDFLPIIQTKAPSSVTFSGEVARLQPGHSRAISKDGGTSFIDDFEASETPYDLTRTPMSWKLGATPKRFPESDSSSLAYTYRRAKLAWYNIDNVFYRDGGMGKPANIKEKDIFNHFVRPVQPQEVFPNLDRQVIITNEITFDLAYFPSERGPYNYNPNVNADGFLPEPEKNFGALTRAIRNDIDFDNSNIQYLEFWLMDPFLPDANQLNGHDRIPLFSYEENDRNQKVTRGGQLFFNLGSVSEDIMKDGQHAFENGLPIINDSSKVMHNPWGKVTNEQFITNAFDNSPANRAIQDVGLDGLNSTQELQYYQQQVDRMLQNISNVTARDALMADPAGDDFSYYLSDFHDASNHSVIQRYKNFNGLENNSPAAGGGAFTPANTNIPDNEDLNQDNTVSDLEEYYEYKIDINPSRFEIGQNYIIDKQVAVAPGSNDQVTWYQFRIPIREPDSIVGNINGFKSIKFMRMYMTGFPEPVILRFVKLQLVANQWRVYLNNDLNEQGGTLIPEPDPSEINVSTVNIEQNGLGDANKSPYVLPPGFERDQDATAQNVRRLNEQSLRLCINELQDRNARGVYKLANLDLLNYNNLRMFVHAESDDPNTRDTEMEAFLRLGTDFVDNYYEINIPLYLTHDKRNSDPYNVWRVENELNILLEDLVEVKVMRDRDKAHMGIPYTVVINGREIAVKGRPDLSSVQTLMIGLRNPASPDKQPKSVCIWVNELRVTNFNERAGWAAAGRVNVKLADLANVTGSLRYTSAGFGSLEQRVSQRERNNTLEWGVASNITLDKFLPRKLGLKLPMYVSYDKRIITPQYDPIDGDVRMEKTLEKFTEKEERDAYRDLIIDQTTRKSINFTNVQKIKTNKDAKKHFYDIENLTFTVGYGETKRTNISLQDYTQKIYKGAIGYNYTTKGKNYEPFKKAKWIGKSPYMKLIRDFNFTPVPSNFSFRSDLDRRFTRTVYFEGAPLDGFTQEPLYEKIFTMNRVYGSLWNITKSLSADYNATAHAIIDEPFGEPGSQEYKDSVVSNLLRLGRLRDYNQSIGLNYKLPLDKIPLTNFLNADTRYTGGYTWNSGALGLRDSLGNSIRNERGINVTGRINMDKLYNKVKFLKEINTPPPPAKKPGAPNQPARPGAPPAKPEAKDTTQVKKKEMKGLKTALRGVMSIKTINLTYNITQNMSMAGYMPNAKFFGVGQTLDGEWADPGLMLPFILGSQDADIRYRMAERGYITSNPSSRMMNTPFTQVRNNNITARTNLEPIKDFKIQVEGMKTKGSDYREFFRIDSLGNDFISESPYRSGRYEISYIAIGSAFKGKLRGSEDPYSSEAFEDFRNYRHTIRDRYIANNPGDTSYSLNSQDVMIPAFLSAYSGKSPGKIKLTSFPSIPLPNWRIDFNGLTRIPKIKKIFPSFIISHSYSSKYTIGGFTSSLEYDYTFIDPNRDIEDPLHPIHLNRDGHYIPVYIMDQVVIRETFSPLIGINARTKSKMTYRLEYRKDRMLGLSLSNAQVQENSKNDLVIGFGYIKSGFKFPFRWQGREIPPLKNELNMRFDVTISDQITILRKMEGTNTVTQGNLNVQIRPAIDYMVNQRLNLRFYFDRNINHPRISSSYRRATTQFGVQLRFTLS